ncbi:MULTISPECIES: sugar ABC transporter ATP-binding protein [unclassified Acidisoma]|jgi:ABC-type sugar transport system ATPase subunit|uniref:sugar ABC transporter ATP-binding protein n=1 Tax=unclassified Acidisoma TaxID=2634065 RepID=UPI00131B893F|nr:MULTISPECIES: sugar ABC transporter ATP-binding protein [unclassified Acidisoma]
MAEERLVAQGIVKRYGSATVLHGVALTLRSGEVHGLVGHNGAGKSTLLKVLAGAVAPDGGTILLDGRPVSFASPAAATAAGIACVFQELSLLENLTVTQNLFLAREIASAGILDKQAMRETARRELAANGLNLTGDEKVANLPVAQRQMIEIIGALARNARVILLDEPTTALERGQIDRLVETLRRIARERDVAIVIVDHKLDEIFAVCDHVTALMDGRVVLDAPIATVSHEAVVESIIGQQEAARLQAQAPAVHATAAAKPSPILTARGVGAPRGLRDVSLDLAPGEVLGLYGLAGSGRSRLLRTLYGLEPVGHGTMRLRDRPYRPQSPRAAMREAVVFVSEERKANGFIPDFDAIRNCTLPVLRRHAWGGVIRRQEAEQEAIGVLERLRVRGDIHAPMSRLSGGNQQKALLAKAVLQRPQVLLLDEPTKGIDVGTKAEIHAFIRSLAAQSGVAVLVVSTEEEELLAVCDEVIIMQRGRCSGRRHEAARLDSTTLRRLALETTPEPVLA